MKINIIIILLFTAYITESYAQPELTRSARKKLNTAIDETFQSAEFVLVPSHHAESVFKIIIRETEKGIAYFGSAKGRYDEFDFLVLFSSDWLILRVDILVYRSDHGYEIMNKKWLSQFKGTSGCGIAYGSDIDAISGATLSASALTEAISKFCENRLKQNERLPTFE